MRPNVRIKKMGPGIEGGTKTCPDSAKVLDGGYSPEREY